MLSSEIIEVTISSTSEEEDAADSLEIKPPQALHHTMARPSRSRTKRHKNSIEIKSVASSLHHHNVSRSEDYRENHGKHRHRSRHERSLSDRIGRDSKHGRRGDQYVTPAGAGDKTQEKSVTLDKSDCLVDDVRGKLERRVTTDYTAVRRKRSFKSCHDVERRRLYRRERDARHERRRLHRERESSRKRSCSHHSHCRKKHRTNKSISENEDANESPEHSQLLSSSSDTSEEKHEVDTENLIPTTNIAMVIDTKLTESHSLKVISISSSSETEFSDDSSETKSADTGETDGRSPEEGSNNNDTPPLNLEQLSKADSGGDVAGNTADDAKPADEDEENRPDGTPTFVGSPKLVAEEEDLPPYLPAIDGCRSVDEFQRLNKIEEGSYGVVFRARERRTEEIVALKKLKMAKEKEGFPVTSLREINTLLKSQHPNIVTVREIVVGCSMDEIFIVMDYVEQDLKTLMTAMKKKQQVFIQSEIKCLMQQLLLAVAHLHDNWILHRDLKTSNLLLSDQGVLKVGDFGLAREYGSPLKSYTPVVVTLWYRAPELLLCAKQYSTHVDMWSVGCIFGELLNMGPLFPGKTEADQILKIFKDLGTPNDTIWPGFSSLPAVQKVNFPTYSANRMWTRFSHLTTEMGLDLMNKFLTYDPSTRIPAEQALSHQYFQEAPVPTLPAKSVLEQRKPGKELLSSDGFYMDTEQVVRIVPNEITLKDNKFFVSTSF